MKVLLKDVGTIRAGHPFRGAINEKKNGNGHVIQVKDLDAEGLINFDDLLQTEVVGRGEPAWLQKGDVIFISRGPKLVASAITQDIEHTVCSPHFFVITLQEVVLPEFIAWQLNQGVVQQYLTKHAMGTGQLSVTRKALEDVTMTIPSLEQQKKLMAFVLCLKREQELYQKLINNRQQQLKGVVQGIFSGEVKTV